MKLSGLVLGLALVGVSFAAGPAGAQGAAVTTSQGATTKAAPGKDVVPVPIGAQDAAGPSASATTAAPPPGALATPVPGALADPTPGASAVAAGKAGAVSGPAFQYASPVAGIGMPDGRIGTQDQFTPIGREAAAFHNTWLLWLCAIISLFVLGLMIVTMVKFRRGAHPVPSRTSHNTLIEVIWTLAPVLILVAIAIPSIRLIRHQYSPPPADVTVKVIGNQWFWTYQYPDNGGFEIVSNMLKEKGEAAAGARFRTDADGPRQLAVDERMVIPAGKVVKFIVTSNDVIHSFAMPAFWVKMDANPGLINETWAKVDKPGVYFGQCSELCGARHAYMPIVIEAVTPERYAQWIASKGGTMPGKVAPPTTDSTAATTVSEKSITAAAPVLKPDAAAAKAAPAVPVASTPGAANRAVQQN
jgi:cytochrome c oxidase subunit II